VSELSGKVLTMNILGLVEQRLSQAKALSGDGSFSTLVAKYLRLKSIFNHSSGTNKHKPRQPTKTAYYLIHFNTKKK
jgi:hypothetical protein